VKSKNGAAHNLEIIDSHAHLESEEFDADRAEMLERAQAAGVQAILPSAVEAPAQTDSTQQFQ